MMREVKFTHSEPGCDRLHHVTEKDIRVVLARLPEEVRHRLQAVHFNDQSKGGRILGYVNPGHREIAICALPPRVSLTRFLVRGQSCAEFGAVRGTQWPEMAVRRFLLYDVFLHELGHLQIINERPRSERLRFAREKFAEEFADYWRRRLWLTDFDHADPVHNAPPEFNNRTNQKMKMMQGSIFNIALNR
jgi:hypothetical protein